MTTETFDFSKGSRWDLAMKLFGVFWSRKMAVAYDTVTETAKREVVMSDGTHKDS